MSSDDSDEDFVPGAPEKLSEEESADDETDLQYERELEQKNLKRKPLPEIKPTKKLRTKGEMKQIERTPEELEEQNKPGEEKNEDNLWASFLEGTDANAQPKDKDNTNNLPTKNETAAKDKPQTVIKEVTKEVEDQKAKDRKIFEFAGETLVVEDNVIKEKIKTTDAEAKKLEATSSTSSRKSGGSGLSGVLGMINKKNKLSTLDKSKLDWETYKQQEGIADEVTSDNKSKKGYLDRQDFLERADIRQYEIERDLRMSRRSKR